MAKFSMCSPWTSINVLMLNHRRVVVKASQPGWQPNWHAVVSFLILLPTVVCHRCDDWPSPDVPLLACLTRLITR